METTVRVFVVEYDSLVRETLQAALQNGGYEVAAASSCEEAIAMLEAEAPDIRVLISDVNFPPGKLTGWDVAKRARELKPDVPVVYTTGASVHEWASNGVPNSVLLEKPFASAQVVSAVSQLLNVAGSSAYTQDLGNARVSVLGGAG